MKKRTIRYLSDAFVALMVVLWALVVIVMTVCAVYSTIVLGVNDVWEVVGTVVAVPLTAGGAVWLIKCSLQHAYAAKNGTSVEVDFDSNDTSG